MNYNLAKVMQLREWVVRSLEGEISEQQALGLNELLKDPDMRKLYLEFLDINESLREVNWRELNIPTGLHGDGVRSFDLWQSLAQDEIQADTLNVPRKDDVREQAAVCKVEYQKNTRKNYIIPLITAIVSLAALIFLIIYANIASVRSGVEVATLTDSINANWSETSPSLEKGSRIVPQQETLLLNSGLAEITFDNQAKVVIEGPAKFEIATQGQMNLEYGRIYTKVPKEAIGFTICSSNAKIIDLGTEFGVFADAGGITELHVIKGQTMLIAGGNDSKETIAVTSGIAKKVSGAVPSVTNIPCDQKQFIRTIVSKKGVAWRGQGLDLTDIVGSGNGLGTGQDNILLSPVSGVQRNMLYKDVLKTDKYLPIESNPYVDGIFIPGSLKPQIISSKGTVFAECPQTSGESYAGVGVNPADKAIATRWRQGTIKFDGKTYGNKTCPCLVTHANIGITFDLKAIRTILSEKKITRFVSKIGIADLKERHPCNADFWVLVDGQLRFSKKQVNQKGVLSDLSVELLETDQFLTLVTTDGGDPYRDQGKIHPNDMDWCIFAEPVLEVE